MSYFIYTHKKKTNGEIFYIGRGTTNTRRNKTKSNRNIFWHNVVKKHGFIDEVISEKLTKVQANNLERFLIKEIGRRDMNAGPLVNMTEGGDGVHNISEITRRKMCENHADVSGENNPMFGKSFKHTKETKEKIRQTSLGRLHTKETKVKMSGKNNHMFGKTFNHTDEAKLKISLASKGKKQAILTCPHCKQEGGTTMYRWHFDNCKKK